jgi:dipeptidyl aminopeptidase/acylaminoacyl peptidase
MPESNRCAVAFAAVTSIDYMFDNAQADMSLLADRSTLMAERIGDPRTERARFRRVSPLHNAERVGVPVLLACGATDVRVPLVHGTDFRAALDKHGKEHEWVLYPEEGHGLDLDANVVDFYARVDRFLAKHLDDGAPGSVARPATAAR